jgi:cytochrome P450
VSVDAGAYDPFSDAAMADPFALYRDLRTERCPHFIAGRKAWALTTFKDVWRASLNESLLDFSHGQTPGQLMLGEPCPTTFMTMNAQDHRKWRAVLADFYTPEAAEADRPRLRALVREILEPMTAAGHFDVFADFANRVMCRNAGYNLGFSSEESERFRALIDDMLHREPGQVGASSPRNQQAAGVLFGALTAKVEDLRRHPERAVRQAKALVEAVVDGRSLSDQELTFYMFSLLVVGSETTPLSVASAIYLLAQHPEQKAAVLKDRSLVPALYRETLRFYQPTNMLARRAAADFELGGQQIRAGDNLLVIYASANRDEERFPDAERFDIHRDGPRDLAFGIGGHVCLGASLAMVAGCTMLEELLDAVGDYALIGEGCRKSYGEFLLGYTAVPIRFQPPAMAASGKGEGENS